LASSDVGGVRALAVKVGGDEVLGLRAAAEAGSGVRPKRAIGDGEDIEQVAVGLAEIGQIVLMSKE
jgi:hypothetical protein